METGIVLCTSVALIGGVIALILLISAYHPGYRRRQALLRQAHEDFTHARGAQHLRLLRERQPVLEKRLARLEDALARLQGELQALSVGEQQALRQAAEHRMLREHIHEIQGVGSKHQDALLQMALQGGLEQLYAAQASLSGIGDARQAAINAWVRQMQPSLAAFLHTDFPEKAALQAQYAARRSHREARLADLTDQYGYWRTIETCLLAELERLEQVDESHLAQAWLAPDPVDPALAGVEHYLQGVSGEWEPLPDWFIALVDLRAP